MDQGLGCTGLCRESSFLWFLLFLFGDCVSDHQMCCEQGAAVRGWSCNLIWCLAARACGGIRGVLSTHTPSAALGTSPQPLQKHIHEEMSPLHSTVTSPDFPLPWLSPGFNPVSLSQGKAQHLGRAAHSQESSRVRT